jgi:hypothetical protein
MKSSKKSLLIIGTLVRVLAALAVIFLIVIPACNKVRSAFFDNDKKFLGEFDKFVKIINDIPPNQGRQYLLGIKEDSALVGFSKNGDLECYNCGRQYRINENPHEIRMIFKRPVEDHCIGNACVCLCMGLDFDDVRINHEGRDVNVKSGSCKSLTCTKISENSKTFDSPVELPIHRISLGNAGHRVYLGKWENGFIFSRGVRYLDGLEEFDENNMQLFIQKKGDTIGVCNSDMITHNREKYGLGSVDYNECIQP